MARQRTKSNLKFNNMMNEKEYTLHKSREILNTRRRQFYEIRTMAINMGELGLESLCKFRIDKLSEEIEDLESRLDTEIRKNNLGLKVIIGDK